MNVLRPSNMGNMTNDDDQRISRYEASFFGVLRELRFRPVFPGEGVKLDAKLRHLVKPLSCVWEKGWVGGCAGSTCAVSLLPD